MIQDPYYDRPEVSNSDLSWLKKQFQTQEEIHDVEQAWRFGTLLDCRITEPHKVDVYRGTCAGNQYTRDEMDLAGEMKLAFYQDPFCAQLANRCSFQRVTVRPRFVVQYGGFTFELPARCKWDLFVEAFDLSGDIKTTTAETQKQFEDACRYFDYPRQRSWYMDLEERSHDVLIGISKKNLRVFKVFIERGGGWYNDGKAAYQDLAFKWWTLFGDVKPAPVAASKNRVLLRE